MAGPVELKVGAECLSAVTVGALGVVVGPVLVVPLVVVDEAGLLELPLDPGDVVVPVEGPVLLGPVLVVPTFGAGEPVEEVLPLWVDDDEPPVWGASA